MSFFSSPVRPSSLPPRPALVGCRVPFARLCRTAVAVAAMQALAGAACAGGVVYRATTVPFVYGGGFLENSDLLAINNAGQAVGQAASTGIPGATTFLFSNGVVTPLQTTSIPGGVTVSAISDPVGPLGLVRIAGGRGNEGVVQTYNSALGTVSPGTTFSVTSRGTVTFGVNASGQVVGAARDGFGLDQPFLRQSNGDVTMLEKNNSLDRGGVAMAINNAGLVAGAITSRNFVTNAATWQDGLITVHAGLAGGDVSVARSLNANGWLAGHSNTSFGGVSHAVVWRDGAVNRVAANLEASGHGSVAFGVNNSGQVVGDVTLRQGGGTAAGVFLDSASSGSVNLQPLIVGLAPGQVVDHISGINDVGQIVARATFTGVLLSPEGTLSWARLAGGSAGDATNWDSGLGFAPNRLLDVVISSRASQTVRVEADLQAKSLQVGALSSDTAGGWITLQLANGAVVQPGSDLTVQASGTLMGDGRVASSVINRGTVLAQADQRLRMDGSLDNHGLVTGNGRIDANLINRGDAQGVRVGAGQVLTLAGTVHTNGDGAAIHVADGGELRFVGSVVNQGGAVVQLNRGTLRLDTGLVNGGQVQVSFGGANVFGDVVNRPAGKVIASGGSQTTFWNGVVNDGEFRAAAGSKIVYFGAVSGSGSFVTEGAGAYHRFEGGYSPGHSPADVQVGRAQFASTLLMEIGGLHAGTEHDRIHFSASVLFDEGSILNVALLDSWTPHAGDLYQLFDFTDSPSGSFGGMNLPTLTAGLYWDSSRLYSNGVLGVAAIPEPQTWALWGLGLLGVGWRRRKA